nr:hypothetical protein CFP56_24156 [Quercus suber]
MSLVGNQCGLCIEPSSPNQQYQHIHDEIGPICPRPITLSSMLVKAYLDNKLIIHSTKKQQDSSLRLFAY